MVVPESHNDKLSPNGSVGRGTIPQYGSYPSASQHSGSPQRFISNGSISTISPSIHHDPEYTETDFLLPSQTLR
ncbi:hypothetical protein CgunFtcFv8_013403 [Champsocephalus gunnari]|uniref:Uncharacterized protein n=1 Tax=Champsocephalus gunnari TaxID=52237 RepID=A0AAN8DUE3_CHAGU|nr:hypothetical protein CgunFtcFv8_013403 [Champsocephalus gunnari]